jgi:hypothetical protein
MAEWLKDELLKIADADDLHISPFREDGVTYGTPTWIWSVVVDDALYVRAYNGQHSRWFQAAVKQRAGRITVAGMTKEVNFEQADVVMTASTAPTVRSTVTAQLHDRRTRPFCNCQGHATIKYRHGEMPRRNR